MSVFAEYYAVLQKVGAKTDEIMERRKDAMTCASGCAQCCTDNLTVLAVEAYAIVSALEEDETWQAPKKREGKCVFLGEDDRCSIYQSRPMVCRTHGFPLRNPQTLKSSSLRILQEGVQCCALNFAEAGTAKAEPADIINETTIQSLMVVVNQRFCEGQELAASTRFALSDIAAEFA